MTLKRGTSFTGVPYEQALTRATVLASDLDAVAADQAYVYETTTGKNADGAGGASTNTAHKHAEGGNALYWPMMHQVFGSSQDLEINSSVLQTFSRPIEISTSSGTTPVSEFILFAFPFYVSPGLVDLPFEVQIECTGDDPEVLMTVKNSSLTEVQSDIAFSRLDQLGDNHEDAQFIWAATIPGSTLSPAGLYVVEITVDIQARDSVRRFHSISMAPYLDPLLAARPKTPKPPVGTSNITTVPSWQPIDSALVQADFPLGPAALLLMQNNARVYEEATGLPAPGNATATASGHNHDGSNSDDIGFNIASFCLGSMTSSGAIAGNNSKSPIATNNTYDEVQVVHLRMPVNVNTAASTTSKLKAAVYTYSDSSKTGFPQVQIATTAGGASASFYTAAANDFNLMSATSGATSFSYDSGAYCTFTVSFRSTSATPNSTPRLLGWCIYLQD